jgi:hypothetical protein
VFLDADKVNSEAWMLVYTATSNGAALERQKGLSYSALKRPVLPGHGPVSGSRSYSLSVWPSPIYSFRVEFRKQRKLQELTKVTYLRIGMVANPP